MNWPLSQEYNEAIQCPADNFADPDLKRSEPATNAFGVPMPCSGNFADVYQMRSPDGSRWAVKCFTRETPGLRERYDAISRHLRQVKLPFTVDFTYLDQGIRVSGRWFPVVKMPWVEGLTLSQFVARAADKPATLEALLQIWKRMGKHLRAAQVAHCDLQHGNVLLVPGAGDSSLSLKLVDYDGMWVPALAGKKSGEVGHPSYQHPRRSHEQTYSLEVDRFPLLLVATALRALKAGGGALWERYDNGDNLLFAEADLADPGKSAVFRELPALGDPLTAELSAAVVRALGGPVESAPLLEELMPEPRPARAVPVAAPAPPRRTPREPEETTAPAPPPRLPRPLRAAKAAGMPMGLWIGGGVAALVVIGGVAAAVGSILLKKDPHPEVAAAPPPVPSSLAGPLPAPRGSATPPAGRGPTSREEKPPSTERTGPGPAKPPVEAPAVALDPDPNGPPGEIRRFEGHAEGIWGLACSPDGRRVASCGSDNTCRLWDVSNAKETGSILGHTFWGATFSGDGQTLLSLGTDKTMRLWDVAGVRELMRFEGHTETVDAAIFTSEKEPIFSASRDGTCRRWDPKTGREIGRIADGTGPHYAMAYTPRGNRLLLSGPDHSVCLYDARTGQELKKMLGHGGDIHALAFSPDGGLALSAGADNTIRVWDLVTGKQRRLLDRHTDHVVSAVFSPDGRRILSGSQDKTVRLWDVETGREVCRLDGHTDKVRCVAFLPDGRLALSGSLDKTMQLWRLPPLGYVPPDAPGVAKKPDVPDVDALKAAEAEVRKVYKDQFAKKQPAELLALAAQLLKDGEATRDKPAERFVLLREARDAAARGGDVTLALRVAERMAAHFDVDVLAMKAEALEAHGRVAAQPLARVETAIRALAFADDAAEADNYDAAERLAKAAQANTANLTGLPAAAAAAARVRELTAVRKAHPPAVEADKALAARPDDPDASLALGRFHALARGDWDRGLALLARGSDAKLKDLAQADLAFPADPASAEGLADAYEAHAASESGAAKAHLMCRALYWYEQAAARLSGIDRTKAENKVATIDKTLSTDKTLTPLRPVVLYARYGAYRHWADVTHKVRWGVSHTNGQRLSFKVTTTEFAIPDPAPNEFKSLVVVYRYRGGTHLSVTGELAQANIPPAPGTYDTAPGKPAAGQELVVLHARFGNQGTYANVTAQAQAAVKGKTLSAVAEQLPLGDPFFGRKKAFIVVYRDSGRVRLSISAPEDAIKLGGEPAMP
jgi:hypothetical protein